MSGGFWNDPAIILYILLFIVVVDNLWLEYLLLREILVAYRVEQVPPVLRPYLPQEVFDKMRAYKLHKSCFILVNTFIVVIVCGCLELYFGFLAILWQVAVNSARWKWMEHEIWLSIIFIMLLSVYLTLKSLPGHIYECCCIPSLVNRQQPSVSHRILMQIINTILSLLLMSLVIAAVVALVQALGKYFCLGLYAVSVLIIVLIIITLPWVIDPFMGKRVRLGYTPLMVLLEELTRRVGFPISNVYIIRVRDPNTPSNAFFYGCGCLKRIVIFDTLLVNRGMPNADHLPAEDQGKGLRDPLVVAVVAHELGHWKNGHFCKTIIMVQIHILLTLLLFYFCFFHAPIYQAVGFEMGVQPIIPGFIIIFGFVLTPYFTISNVTMHSVTRQFEYQADKFAFRLGHAGNLKLALLKLYADNLTFPISDPCYSSWHHTHPTMLHRLERLDQLQSGRT